MLKKLFWNLTDGRTRCLKKLLLRYRTLLLMAACPRSITGTRNVVFLCPVTENKSVPVPVSETFLTECLNYSFSYQQREQDAVHEAYLLVHFETRLMHPKSVHFFLPTKQRSQHN